MTVSSGSSWSACGTTPIRARIAEPSTAGIEIEDPQFAGGDRRDTADHAHRRGLAGAVRAEEPERLALLDVEVDAVDRDEVAELLAQIAGGDHGGRHEVRRYRGTVGRDPTGYRRTDVDSDRPPRRRRRSRTPARDQRGERARGRIGRRRPDGLHRRRESDRAGRRTRRRSGRLLPRAGTRLVVRLGELPLVHRALRPVHVPRSGRRRRRGSQGRVSGRCCTTRSTG